MSWFKRTPRAKEPPRAQPHRSSPVAERMFQETKKSGPEKPQPQPANK